jgi:hypothetical protein
VPIDDLKRAAKTPETETDDARTGDMRLVKYLPGETFDTGEPVKS